MNKVVHSSASVEWSTPPKFYQMLNEIFRFTLDPCATKQNAKCEKFFTKKEDGLHQDWRLNRVFVNPPYGKTASLHWIRKCYTASLKGATCVALVPSRTDTKWFHSYVLRTEHLFIRGRLAFGGSSDPAPFPSLLVFFYPPLKVPYEARRLATERVRKSLRSLRA